MEIITLPPMVSDMGIVDEGVWQNGRTPIELYPPFGLEYSSLNERLGDGDLLEFYHNGCISINEYDLEQGDIEGALVRMTVEKRGKIWDNRLFYIRHENIGGDGK